MHPSHPTRDPSRPRLTLERAYEQLAARLDALTELVRAHLLRESLSERTLLTLPEAALLTGKRVATLRRYCREGRLQAERAPYGYGGGGWEYRLRRDEIDRYLNHGLRPGPLFPDGEPRPRRRSPFAPPTPASAATTTPQEERTSA